MDATHNRQTQNASTGSSIAPLKNPEHIIRQVRQARHQGAMSDPGQPNARDTMPVSDLAPKSLLARPDELELG